MAGITSALCMFNALAFLRKIELEPGTRLPAPRHTERKSTPPTPCKAAKTGLTPTTLGLRSRRYSARSVPMPRSLPRRRGDGGWHVQSQHLVKNRILRQLSADELKSIQPWFTAVKLQPNTVVHETGPRSAISIFR